MKKIIALVLALAMVLMVGAAFAVQADDGVITINGKAGYTYSIYRLLDVEYNEETGAFRYYENAKWADFYATSDFTTYFNTSTENGVTYVSAKDTLTETTAATLAQKALAYAKDTNHPIAPEASKAAGDDEKAVFNGLKYGYYLADSSMGALCMLNSAIPNQTINEKNDKPEIEKKIIEGTNLVDENTASIGDVVNYQAKITVQKGAENYVMHDVMETGLTYQGVESVKIGSEDVPSAKYTVKDSGITDGCTFEISFDNEYMAGLTAGTQIIVKYSAKINEQAEISTESNDNTVTLKYGDGTNVETTPPDTVKTYVFKFDLIKHNADNVVIEGATFRLYKTKNAETNAVSDEIKVVAVDGGYRVATEEEASNAVIITAGKPTISGLATGTYYLKEIEAPKGYNLIETPIDVVIGTTNNTAELELDAEKGTYTWVTGGVPVLNQTGSTLPSTGGIGTTIFYILGGLLVVGAAVILVARRKAQD